MNDSDVLGRLQTEFGTQLYMTSQMFPQQVEGKLPDGKMLYYYLRSDMFVIIGRAADADELLEQRDNGTVGWEAEFDCLADWLEPDDLYACLAWCIAAERAGNYHASVEGR